MSESEHIEKSRIERFCVSALPEVELIASAEHLAKCVSCHNAFIDCSKRLSSSEQLDFTLAPEFWSRHDHLEYEQLSALADKTLAGEERQILDAHLRTCGMCREVVTGFLASRDQLESQLDVSSTTAFEKPRSVQISTFGWWRRFTWNPAYAAAAVIIVILAAIGVAVLLKRRAETLEAKQTPPPQASISPPKQTPTLENQAGNLQPTPTPIPPEQPPRREPSPALAVQNKERPNALGTHSEVIALNDGHGKVTIDRSGNGSVLDEIPKDIRQQIGEALLAENIKPAATNTELAGGPLVLRGSRNGLTFKLLSPGRTVITSDRPSFAWEKLPGAISYRVSVGDLNGHEIAKSEILPANQTTWTAPSPLKRGEVYSWEVEAVLDGKKIYAPGSSETERKFKVLSASGEDELIALKKTRSHLALAVFYAREGIVDDAEREFQILIQKNPESSVLKQLLKQLQSWRPE